MARKKSDVHRGNAIHEVRNLAGLVNDMETFRKRAGAEVPEMDAERWASIHRRINAVCEEIRAADVAEKFEEMAELQALADAEKGAVS
jgi:hypothetical protein